MVYHVEGGHERSHAVGSGEQRKHKTKRQDASLLPTDDVINGGRGKFVQRFGHGIVHEVHDLRLHIGNREVRNQGKQEQNGGKNGEREVVSHGGCPLVDVVQQNFSINNVPISANETPLLKNRFRCKKA